MNKFLETYCPRKLNQEEIDYLNRFITRSETQSIKKKKKKKTPCKQKSRTSGFTGEFYQTYKEELTQIILKQLQKIKEKGTLPKSFYEATITLIPTQDKDHQKRKLQANIFDECRCKSP